MDSETSVRVLARKPHVILYGRQGCHLCEEMRAVIERVGQRVALELEEIDVDAQPALRARYDTEVPVVAVDGVEVSRHRITEDTLLRALASA
jgi:glutaredoxin